MALLEIRNVTRRFGGFEAVKNVSFEVNAGEFFTLLGPSGCGKTTILRMIAGFDLPDEGSIVLDGVDLKDTPPEKRPIHTVFQSYALFPHMTVVDNVAFPLKMAGASTEDIRSKVKATLDLVHLSEKGEPISARTLRRTETARGARAFAGQPAAAAVARRATGRARRQVARAAASRTDEPAA